MIIQNRCGFHSLPNELLLEIGGYLLKEDSKWTVQDCYLGGDLTSLARLNKICNNCFQGKLDNLKALYVGKATVFL